VVLLGQEKLMVKGFAQGRVAGRFKGFSKVLRSTPISACVKRSVFAWLEMRKGNGLSFRTSPLRVYHGKARVKPGARYSPACGPIGQMAGKKKGSQREDRGTAVYNQHTN